MTLEGFLSKWLWTFYLHYDTNFLFFPFWQFPHEFVELTEETRAKNINYNIFTVFWILQISFWSFMENLCREYRKENLKCCYCWARDWITTKCYQTNFGLGSTWPVIKFPGDKTSFFLFYFENFRRQTSLFKFPGAFSFLISSVSKDMKSYSILHPYLLNNCM